MNDIVHKVAAVGSRAVKSAEAFIAKNAPNEKDVNAYGTYAEVYADKVPSPLLYPPS